MHKELEELMNLTLAKGYVTEKEKEILCRKAEKLGEDVDEFTLILENNILALSPKEQDETPEKETDNFDITDEELVIRCTKWVNLTSEKTYKGNVKSFPAQKSSNKVLNSAFNVGKNIAGVAIDNFKLSSLNPLGYAKLAKTVLKGDRTLKNDQIAELAEAYLSILEFRREKSELLDGKFLELKGALELKKAEHEKSKKRFGLF